MFFFFLFFFLKGKTAIKEQYGSKGEGHSQQLQNRSAHTPPADGPALTAHLNVDIMFKYNALAYILQADIPFLGGQLA